MTRNTKGLNAAARTSIIERDDSQCHKCGQEESLQVHHITPRYLGGSNEPANLLTLCAKCHDEWHYVELATTMPFPEWLQMPRYTALVTLYQTVMNPTPGLTIEGLQKAAQLLHTLCFLHRTPEPEREDT